MERKYVFMRLSEENDRSHWAVVTQKGGYAACEICLGRHLSMDQVKLIHQKDY